MRTAGPNLQSDDLATDGDRDGLLLLERFPKLARVLPEVGAGRQDDPARAQPVRTRVIDARRSRAVRLEGLRGFEEASADTNDRGVGVAEVLVGAVDDAAGV